MNKNQHLFLAISITAVIFLATYSLFINPILREIKNKKRTDSLPFVSQESVKNLVSIKDSMTTLVNQLIRMQLEVEKIAVLHQENNVAQIMVECRGKPVDVIRFLVHIANENPRCILSSITIAAYAGSLVKAVLQYDVSTQGFSAISNISAELSLQQDVFSKPSIVISDY